MRSPLSVLLLVLLSSVMSAKVSDSLLAAGAGKYHKGNYAKSFEIFDAAAGMARQQKDSATLIFAYRNLGNICSQTGRQVEALDFYQKSVSLSDAAGNLRESANTIRNIGALYGEMGDYKKALANYNIAETISITYKDTASIADCANNKGVIYEQYLQQYPAAILEYTKALELYKKMNNEERVSIAYNNLGIVYKATGNYEKAIACYEQSLAIAIKGGYRFLAAANFTNIGNVYAVKKDYAKAIYYNKKGLETAKTIKAMNVMVEAAKSIAEDYEGLKDYREAYSWHKLYALYNDSMINSDRIQQVAELETKYQNEKKEKELIQLRQQQQINALKLSAQSLQLQKRRLQLWAQSGLVLLGIIVTVFFIRGQRLKQKRQYEQDLRKAEDEERKRISREMHDDIGAGLTRITLISQAAAHGGNIETELADIAGTSRKLISSIGEIIWSLDPESKTLDQLYAYMREQLGQLLEYTDIAYEVDFPDNVPEIGLTSQQKRALLLVTKEAVNNAVKYSQATTLSVTSSVAPHGVSFAVSDNGKGFDPAVAKRGNGLRNMRHRIEELKGSFLLESVPGQTTVRYGVPL